MPVIIAPPLEMSVAQRSALEQIARSESLPFRRVRQARGLLLAADGVANEETARRVGVSSNTVRAWRKRFTEDGVEGGGGDPSGSGTSPGDQPGGGGTDSFGHVGYPPGGRVDALVDQDDCGPSRGGKGHRGPYLESAGTATLANRDVQAALMILVLRRSWWTWWVCT